MKVQEGYIKFFLIYIYIYDLNFRLIKFGSNICSGLFNIDDYYI